MVCVLETTKNVRISAVAVGWSHGAVPPLTTACAPPFWFAQNTISKHHVTTRQQATMEKGMIKRFSVTCDVEKESFFLWLKVSKEFK